MNRRALADRILLILDCVAEDQALFEQAAAQRGIGLNALLAASIAGMLDADDAAPTGLGWDDGDLALGDYGVTVCWDGEPKRNTRRVARTKVRKARGRQ